MAIHAGDAALGHFALQERAPGIHLVALPWLEWSDVQIRGTLIICYEMNLYHQGLFTKKNFILNIACSIYLLWICSRDNPVFVVKPIMLLGVLKLKYGYAIFYLYLSDWKVTFLQPVRVQGKYANHLNIFWTISFLIQLNTADIQSIIHWFSACSLSVHLIL